jgi:DNA-binding transcriptional LysR family regulator
MNWDDLRFVLALCQAGSLARAAKALGVDHTTVGRRIDTLERDLGVKLFTRTTRGYVATAEAERLLPDIRHVESAILAIERVAHAHEHETLEGAVRVTSGETFGSAYLAPRLASFGREHPSLTLELVMGGEILDLARREADIAVRTFRSKHESLVVRRVGENAHGLYASRMHVARRPWTGDLRAHPILTASPGPSVVEAAWVQKLARGSKPAFVTNLTTALLEAARAGAGVAVLPRYLGDADPALVHLPMEGEPRETLWLTVHRDLKSTRRVRVVLDFLVARLKADARLLLGG